MAAKVFLRSVDQKTVYKVKRSRADSLVRRLLAIQVSRYLYQLVRVKASEEIDPAQPNNYIPWGLEPSIDARIGVIVQAPILEGQVRFRPVERAL